ncbi:Acg family FMN-binding oxidoreductase [Parasediminibacterium paludis]|uniref:Acg family FMN-binding oxidoreductase n=1 Tax=Parasediminibacterium paludis TaxID=908966 RepID=A0ABV8PW35_9BACT
MKRKDFLLATGSLITAAMLSRLDVQASKFDNTRGDNYRPTPSVLDVPILQVLCYGVNSPNPHNTQAWKFKIETDTSCLFYVDETRLLTATDPIARQIHIGCGCFIALAEIGARELGYGMQIDYLPEGDYSYHEIGKKPLAKLKINKINPPKDPLFNVIYKRQTLRTIYHGNLISNDEFNNIVEISQPKYSAIELINNSAPLKEALDILYKGMEVECYDWHAFDESRKWFRVKEDIALKKDGLNLRVSGVKGLNLWVSEQMLTGYPSKLWHDNRTINGLLAGHYEKVMSSKGIVLFKTTSNQLADWIKCGQDYARFQLAACQKGIGMHPLSQVLQEYPSMQQLSSAFEQMMQIEKPMKIQMAVRIGRSHPDGFSYRRNTKDLIINS